MDVVIIAAKLVCHLCYVCKLVYFSGAPSSKRRKKIEGTRDNEERSTVIVEYLDSFLMLYGYMGNADEGTPKYKKNNTSKTLQCTRHCTTGLGY
jgi:hypothetical protein